MSYLETAKKSLEAIRKRPVMDQWATLSIDGFAQAGSILRVASAALRREVFFVSDNVQEADIPEADLPVYRASELRKLAVLRPDTHRPLTVHDLALIFQGVITDVQSCT